MLVRQAADDENKARSTKEGKLVADIKLVGDRTIGTDGAHRRRLCRWR
jgi:hypothetical protein